MGDLTACVMRTERKRQQSLAQKVPGEGHGGRGVMRGVSGEPCALFCYLSIHLLIHFLFVTVTVATERPVRARVR